MTFPAFTYKTFIRAAAAFASFEEKVVVAPQDIEAKLRRLLQNITSEQYNRRGKRDDTPRPLSRSNSTASATSTTETENDAEDDDEQ